MRSLHTLIIFFAISILATVDAQDKPGSIKAEELKEWVEFLSSDDMKGRLNGSPKM